MRTRQWTNRRSVGASTSRRVRREGVRVALAIALLAMLLAPWAHAGPQGEHVVRGNVRFDRAGATTTIHAGNRAIINYASFDIQGHETVRFVQPSSTSRVLNRIRSATPTQIDGALQANGIVYIVNPAGVMFGPDCVVDVGGIYAAAASISNADFLNGLNQFTDAAGAVENRGTIRGSAVHLLGRHVANHGSIIAPQGLVTMVAGKDVLLTEIGSHVMVKIEGDADAAGAAPAPSAEKPGVENTGTVQAPGGRVLLGAGDLFSIAARHSGAIEARDVTVEGQAGTTEVSGTIDASGQTGGKVKVLGETVALTGADIQAPGGEVLVGGDVRGANPDVRNAGRTLVDGETTISAEGGKVVVWSDELTVFAGEIYAPEGFVEVSSAGWLVFQGTVTAETVLLDPTTITVQSANPDIDDNGTTGDDITALTDLDSATLDYPGADSIITSGAVDGLLTASNTLILAATTAITIDDAITGGGNASLTLDAPTVSLNDTITLAGTGVLTGGTGTTTVNVGSGGGVQNGLDVASSASGAVTVNVAAGTYTEDLTITTNNLELAGASDANPGQTVIVGVGSQSGFPDATSSTNVDLQANGVEIHGFTFRSPQADASTQSYSSGMVLKGTDIEIHHNVFDIRQINSGTFNGDTSSAIQTYSGAVVGNQPVDIDGLHIHDNTFQGTPANGYYGVYVNPQDQAIDNLKPVIVENNTFTGTIWRAITTERDYVTIRNNSITTGTSNAAGGNSGIRVLRWGAQDINNIIVKDNLVTGSGGGKGFAFGIGLGYGAGGGSLTTVSVTENQVSGDHVLGVDVGVTLNSVTIADNSFIGGTTAYFRNTTAATVDARGNWWGTTSDATIQTRISNTGGGSVTYSPWLNAAGSSTTGPFDYTPVDTYNIISGGNLQTAIGFLGSGDTLDVSAGDYSAQTVNLNLAATLNFDGDSQVGQVTTAAGSALSSDGALNVQGTASLAGDVSTSGTLDFDQAVTISGTVQMTTGGGLANFDNNVNGLNNNVTLSLDTTGTPDGDVTLQAVGNAQPLGELVISAGTGIITLNGTQISTTAAGTGSGNITFGSSLELTADTTVNTGGGDLDCSSTQVYSDGADQWDLTVNTGGGNVLLSNFSDRDETATDIGSHVNKVTLNAAGGDLTFSGGAITLETDLTPEAPDLAFNGGGAVIVAGDQTVNTNADDSGNSGAVNLGAGAGYSSGGNFSLGIDASSGDATAGTVSLGDMSDNATVDDFLSGLTITGGTLNLNDVETTGGQSYTGTTINVASAYQSDGLPISFTGAVVLASSSTIDTESGGGNNAGTVDLSSATVSASGGGTDLGIDTSTPDAFDGGGVQLGTFDASGGAAVNNLTITTTSGTGATHGAVAMAATGTNANPLNQVQLTSGAVTFAGDVYANTQDYSNAASATITAPRTFDADGAGGNIDFTGTNIARTAATDTLTLTAGAADRIILADVGASGTELLQVTVSSGIVRFTGDVYAETQDYTAAASAEVSGTPTLDATAGAGDIDFTGTNIARTNPAGDTLTLASQAGDSILLAQVGAAGTELSSLAVTSGIVSFGGDVYADGQNYVGAASATVTAPRIFDADAGAGAIDFTGVAIGRTAGTDTLTFRGQATDAVILGPVGTGASPFQQVTVASGIATFTDDVFAGTQDYTGAASAAVDGTPTLDATSGVGDIDFTGTNVVRTNATDTLTLTAGAADRIILADVGASGTELLQVTVSSGIVRFTGDVYAETQDYTAAASAEVSGTPTLDATAGAGDIDFTGTNIARTNPAGDTLTLASQAGDSILLAQVGAAGTELSSLAVTSGIVSFGGDVYADGQNYVGAASATVTAPRIFDADAGAGAIDFTGVAIGRTAGTDTLTFRGQATDAVILGPVGTGASPFQQVTVASGIATFTDDVFAGTQTYSAAASAAVDGTPTLDATSGVGNIDFTGTNIVRTNATDTLTVLAQTGDTVTLANVGTLAAPLESLSVTSGTIGLGAVATSQGQTYNGNPTLNANLTVTTGGAISVTGNTTLGAAVTVATPGAAATDDITFTGTIDGAQVLTINANTDADNTVAGDVVVTGAIGGTAPLTGLGVDNGNPAAVTVNTLTVAAVTTDGGVIVVDAGGDVTTGALNASGAAGTAITPAGGNAGTITIVSANGSLDLQGSVLAVGGAGFAGAGGAGGNGAAISLTATAGPTLTGHVTVQGNVNAGGGNAGVGSALAGGNAGPITIQANPNVFDNPGVPDVDVWPRGIVTFGDATAGVSVLADGGAGDAPGVSGTDAQISLNPAGRGAALTDIPSVATVAGNVGSGNTLTISGSNFVMGVREKMTSTGHLAITVDPAAGNATIGDLNAVNNLSVTGGLVTFLLRGPGDVYRQPGMFITDNGLDYVANTINIPGPTATAGTGANPQAATYHNAGVFPLAYQPILDHGKSTLQVVRGGVFLDLPASGEPRPVPLATALASALPDKEVEVTGGTGVGQAQREDLVRHLGIFIKDPTEEELLEWLGEPRFFQDLPQVAHTVSGGDMPGGPTSASQHMVTIDRLPGGLARQALMTYRAIYWRQKVDAQGQKVWESRAGEIRNVLRKSIGAYKAKSSGEEFDPAAYVKFLATTPDQKDAWELLRRLSGLFRQVELLGLGPVELNISHSVLARYIRPGDISPEELIAAIRAASPGAPRRPLAPEAEPKAEAKAPPKGQPKPVHAAQPTPEAG